MSGSQISRPQYFKNQFLRTQDFTAEQEYLLAMQRRHNIAQHTWGIVQGLDLIVEPDGGLFVGDGVAVDGFGRVQVVSGRLEVPKDAFIQRNAKELDIWLTYGKVGSDRAPDGYVDCGTPDDERPMYRWVERPQLRYSIPDPGFMDRRAPRELTPAELANDATLVPNDDPARPWPIFLGLARLMATGFEVDGAGRPYTGLVGERIDSVSGQTYVQMGPDGRDEDRHFSVHVVEHKPGQQTPTDHTVIALDKESIDVVGRTTVHGDLRLEAGALSFLSPAADGPPSEPRPWHMYRTKVSDLPASPPPVPANAARPGDELRIEIPDNDQASLVVGYWSAKEKKFMECLKVTSKGVEISGDLIINGALTNQEGALRGTPETQSAQVVASLTGAGGAAAFLARPFPLTQLEIEETIGRFRSTAITMNLQQAAQAIAGHELQFAELLRSANPPATVNTDLLLERLTPEGPND